MFEQTGISRRDVLICSKSIFITFQLLVNSASVSKSTPIPSAGARRYSEENTFHGIVVNIGIFSNALADRDSLVFQEKQNLGNIFTYRQMSLCTIFSL